MVVGGESVKENGESDLRMGVFRKRTPRVTKAICIEKLCVITK